jgi:hypothetical protein
VNNEIRIFNSRLIKVINKLNKVTIVNTEIEDALLSKDFTVIRKVK